MRQATIASLFNTLGNQRQTTSLVYLFGHHDSPVKLGFQHICMQHMQIPCVLIHLSVFTPRVPFHTTLCILASVTHLNTPTLP